MKSDIDPQAGEILTITTYNIALDLCSNWMASLKIDFDAENFNSENNIKKIQNNKISSMNIAIEVN